MTGTIYHPSRAVVMQPQPQPSPQAQQQRSMVKPQGYKAVNNQTEGYFLTDKTRRNYRNRIRRIIDFWKAKAPDEYTNSVIREVPTAEYEEETNYFFPSNKKEFKLDLIYANVDSDWYKYFLADAQRLPNGRLASDTHIRKYRDAVMWGAKISKQCLPPSFRMEIEAFHKGYKKKVWRMKKSKAMLQMYLLIQSRLICTKRY